MNEKPSPRRIVLGVSVTCAILLAGCGVRQKSTLLRSDIRSNPPLGPVHLPAQKEGLSFQGSLALVSRADARVDLGTLDKDPSADILSNDSSQVRGTVMLHQAPLVLEGEASVFMSRHFRLFAGAGPSDAFWFGAGAAFGDPWSFELGVANGSVLSVRDELWRIELNGCSLGSCENGVRDTLLAVRKRARFSRLDMVFARRRGGPVVAFQAMSFPVTEASNGDAYAKDFQAFTAGWHQPWPWGTLGAFVRATRFGGGWSPSGQLQYSLDLGGD